MTSSTRGSLSRTRRLVGTAVLCVVTAASLQATGSAAAVGPSTQTGSGGQSLSAARAEAERLRAQLVDLRAQSGESILKLEAAEDQLSAAVVRSVQLGRELDVARTTAHGTSRQVDRRVSALYRAGGEVGMWASLLRASDPQDLVARRANVHAVVAHDRRLRDEAQVDSGRLSDLEAEARENAAERTRAATVADAEAQRIEALMAQQTAALEQTSERVRTLVEEQRRAAAAEAQRRLRVTEAAERAAAAQAAREAALAEHQRAAALARAQGRAEPPLPQIVTDAAPMLSSDGRTACPVGPVHSFTNTWGAPRSGGRRHQGADIFAPHGAPAYAVVDGVIDKWSNGGLGGIALWLRGDNGDRFYYAHNVANVAAVGQRVRAGELIAYVGTTGNAATTPPHIHFQAHPGGGAAVDPHPWLFALCGG